MNDGPIAPPPPPAPPAAKSVAVTHTIAPAASQVLADPSVGTWATEQNFALAQRAAKALATSDLVPESYKGKPANCLIAIDISYHLRISPLTVMQNLHIIHGRPSWGSSFVIGAINSCKLFSPLRFRITRRGKKKVEVTTWTGARGNRTPSRETREIDDIECVAYATELATGETVEGPAVSMEMAILEGWTSKAESKWLTMPDLMLRYRAAAFFGRLYAPDILMGMHTVEEVLDFDDGKPSKAARRGAGGASVLQSAIDEVSAEVSGDVGADVSTSEPTAAPKDEAPAAPATEAKLEPKPSPSKFAAKAMEKEAAGKALNAEEAESIRDYRLDLEAWESRNHTGEPRE